MSERSFKKQFWHGVSEARGWSKTLRSWLTDAMMSLFIPIRSSRKLSLSSSPRQAAQSWEESLDGRVRDTNESRNVWGCRWAEASPLSAHSHFCPGKTLINFWSLGWVQGSVPWIHWGGFVCRWESPVSEFWAAVMTLQSVDHTHTHTHTQTHIQAPAPCVEYVPAIWTLGSFKKKQKTATCKIISLELPKSHVDVQQTSGKKKTYMSCFCWFYVVRKQWEVTEPGWCE